MMIYMFVILGISIGSAVIFFGKKILSNQKENHKSIMTILNKLNELQIDNLKKEFEKLDKGQKTIIAEFAPLYDLANTISNADLYISELKEENKKLKKILKRKIK